MAGFNPIHANAGFDAVFQVRSDICAALLRHSVFGSFSGSFVPPIGDMVTVNGSMHPVVPESASLLEAVERANSGTEVVAEFRPVRVWGALDDEGTTDASDLTNGSGDASEAGAEFYWDGHAYWVGNPTVELRPMASGQPGLEVTWKIQVSAVYRETPASIRRRRDAGSAVHEDRFPKPKREMSGKGIDKAPRFETLALRPAVRVEPIGSGEYRRVGIIEATLEGAGYHVGASVGFADGVPQIIATDEGFENWSDHGLRRAILDDLEHVFATTSVPITPTFCAAGPLRPEDLLSDEPGNGLPPFEWADVKVHPQIGRPNVLSVVANTAPAGDLSELVAFNGIDNFAYSIGWRLVPRVLEARWPRVQKHPALVTELPVALPSGDEATAFIRAHLDGINNIAIVPDVDAGEDALEMHVDQTVTLLKIVDGQGDTVELDDSFATEEPLPIAWRLSGESPTDGTGLTESELSDFYGVVRAALMQPFVRPFLRSVVFERRQFTASHSAQALYLTGTLSKVWVTS